LTLARSSGEIGGISKGSIKLEIPIELGGTHEVEIVDDGTLSSSAELLEDAGPSPKIVSQGLRPISVSLSTLPPLLLDIVLPSSYPLHSAPILLHLHATHSWLSRAALLLLKQKLIAMWAEGEGILYGWVEWFKSGDFLEAVNSTGDRIVHLSHPSPTRLAKLLASHDALSAQEVFSHMSHPCAICMTSLKGSKCIRFACSHVFCRPCLEAYWGMAIREGDIGQVRCPDPECVKEGIEANEEEVRRVVSEDEVKRWKRLREKRDLDRGNAVITLLNGADLTHC